MAKSKFSIPTEEFVISKKPSAETESTPEVPEVPEVKANYGNAEEKQAAQTVQKAASSKKSNIKKTAQVQDTPAEPPKKIEYGTTQGRAGMHMKRMMMSFSDDNYEYLRRQSRLEGYSIAGFINKILDEYRDQ